MIICQTFMKTIYKINQYHARSRTCAPFGSVRDPERLKSLNRLQNLCRLLNLNLPRAKNSNNFQKLRKFSIKCQSKFSKTQLLLRTFTLTYVKFDDKIIFVTFRSFRRKLKKISYKSPKKYFEKILVENGRGHNSAKNQYFFDLVSNIAISSKSTDGFFFNSFEKLFFLGAWVLNNFFSGNFFQKWSIFAVIRLFLPEERPIFRIYLRRYKCKWGLRIEWNQFGHRISLDSCARLILSIFFRVYPQTDIPFGG